MAFQLRSAHVFRVPDVLDHLDLDMAQREELASVRRWMAETTIELQDTLAGDNDIRPLSQESLDVILSGATARILDILTPEQRTQYEALQGAPIAFARSQVRLEIRERK